MVGHPERQDGRIIHCVRGGEGGWSQTSRAQSLSFGIPLNLNLSAFYIVARGQQATGKVTVEPDQAGANDEVTVDIAVQYHERETLEGTMMCLMERKKGERGVGIFVSTSFPDPGYLLNTNKRHQNA